MSCVAGACTLPRSVQGSGDVPWPLATCMAFSTVRCALRCFTSGWYRQRGAYLLTEAFTPLLVWHTLHAQAWGCLWSRQQRWQCSRGCMSLA